MIPTLTIVNSKAVSMLEQGMNQDAVRILSSAVKQCASALFASRPLSPDTPSTFGELFATTAIVSKGSCLANQETEFFSRPFVMFLYDLQENSTQRDKLAGCVAVCCYNMGLACHLEWVRRNRNDSRVLKQAHVFYGKAYNALQLCQLKPTDSLLLLLMAVCTNLISLNLELGQLATVQNLKNNLTAVIRFADNSQYRDNESFRYLYHATVLFRSDLIAARAA